MSSSQLLKVSTDAPFISVRLECYRYGQACLVGINSLSEIEALRRFLDSRQLHLEKEAKALDSIVLSDNDSIYTN